LLLVVKCRREGKRRDAAGEGDLSRDGARLKIYRIQGLCGDREGESVGEDRGKGGSVEERQPRDSIPPTEPWV
jgi:hypothetical protein